MGKTLRLGGEWSVPMVPAGPRDFYGVNPWHQALNCPHAVREAKVGGRKRGRQAASQL